MKGKRLPIEKVLTISLSDYLDLPFVKKDINRYYDVVGIHESVMSDEHGNKYLNVEFSVDIVVDANYIFSTGFIAGTGLKSRKI